MKRSILVRPLMMAVALVHIATLHAQFYTQMGSDIDGAAANDNFGFSISLSQDGSRIAIGAPNNDDAGQDAGQVRVYEWNGGSWTQVGTVINGEQALDRFGFDVALSSDGTRLAVGAIFNAGNGINAGHVRVFEENAGIWTQLGADIDGEGAGDNSGVSVALSADGNRVVVGGPANDDAGAAAGHARVYELIAGAWVQLGSDIDGQGPGDRCGSSVAISAAGTRIAIGSPNSANGTSSGHVRVFSYGSGGWTQVGQDIVGEAMNDRSGHSVSLTADGTRIAIGAPDNNGGGADAGHARVYAESGGSWTQVGIDIDGEGAGDACGHSVSLSGNGTLLAIGALLNGGSAFEAGHARIYCEVGGAWIQVGADIDGEAAGDRAGQSVFFSGDGQRFAVSAIYNDGGGNAAGQVRVYELDPSIGVPEQPGQAALLVMPIPATDVLYIEVPERAALLVFNATGQLVHSQPVVPGRAVIDVTALPSGTYIAELRPYQAGTSRFAKVLVE